MTIRPADNPFAGARIDRLAFRFTDVDEAAVFRRLADSGSRGAIVGRHGRGKTTLLEHLAARLDAEAVWIRLSGATASPIRSALDALPNRISSEHAVLIDGAEQLGGVAWWRLERRLRAAGTVIITSHRPGRLPTIHECTTSPELLRGLVTELAPKLAATVDLGGLFDRHDGNLRLCFRELYDLVK
jgi:hypothetical protein